MKINAALTSVAVISVMTFAVVVLTGVAVDRVKNLPQPLPIAPAADSLAAIEVKMPELEPLVNSEMVDRPLFWKERRPLTTAKVEPETVVQLESGPDPFEQIKLVGVYSGGALITVDGVKQRSHIGDELFGWTLELMSADGIVFIKEGKEKTLHLEHAVVKVNSSPNKNINKQGEKNGRERVERASQIISPQQENQAIQEVPSPTKQQNNGSPNKAELPMPDMR